jgi:hypothetical protein
VISSKAYLLTYKTRPATMRVFWSAETWRRFGWYPTTDEERKARRLSAAEIVVVEVDEVAPVRPIRGRLPGPQGEVVERRELALVATARRADRGPDAAPSRGSGVVAPGEFTLPEPIASRELLRCSERVRRAVTCRQAPAVLSTHRGSTRQPPPRRSST